MKKRILAAIVASALIVTGLAGCGEDTESTPNQPSNSSSSQANNESKPAQSSSSSVESSSAEESSSSSSKPEELSYVIIKGKKYDIATTTRLDLHYSGITDEDVKQIGKLTNLTILNLLENKISDIKPLAGLTNLESLFLNDNQISDADIAWLEEKLPNCGVSS